MEGSGADRLPEACVAHVISFTSPVDACRSSAVSAAFCSAAASDTVWERFLPADCLALLSRAVRPVEFSSKRDLFFRLCDSILIDGGKMSFWLDRRNGAKCLMISARALSIVWGDTPQYWRWISLPDSRYLLCLLRSPPPSPTWAIKIKSFREVAELIDVCWLEIRGKIQSKMLTQNVIYGAFLVFKLADWSRGLARPHQEASITVGLRSHTNVVRFQPTDAAVNARRNQARFGPLWRTIPIREEREEEEGGTPAARAASLPRARDDGWMEVAMGEFYNDDELGGEVVISLMEVKSRQRKKGLIIQGIEIRPTVWR